MNFKSAKISNYLSGLFKITKAAITPGTQPQSHNKNTIKIDPHPLSKTAKGGQIMESKTRQILIFSFDDLMIKTSKQKLKIVSLSLPI